MTSADPNLEQFSLRGKVALVTGGAGGLGRRMALALAGAGANMAVADLNPAGLDEGADEIRRLDRECLTVVADVSHPEDVKRMVGDAVDHFGRLDIAVNSAGINIRKPALEFTENDWDAIIGVNLKGLFFCCQEEARAMIGGGGGRIINVSSLTSEVGLPLRAVYAASKGGVTSVTRVLAAEWAGHGVTVNCIGPGHMYTPLTEKMFDDPQIAGPMIARIPMSRFGYAEDLDGAIVFLASDASAYITGQTIYVDGGYLLNAC